MNQPPNNTVNEDNLADAAKLVAERLVGVEKIDNVNDLASLVYEMQSVLVYLQARLYESVLSANILQSNTSDLPVNTKVIFKILKQRGWSEERIGDAVDINQSQVNRILKGQQPSELIFLRALRVWKEQNLL